MEEKKQKRLFVYFFIVGIVIGIFLFVSTNNFILISLSGIYGIILVLKYIKTEDKKPKIILLSIFLAGILISIIFLILANNFGPLILSIFFGGMLSIKYINMDHKTLKKIVFPIYFGFLIALLSFYVFMEQDNFRRMSNIALVIDAMIFLGIYLGFLLKRNANIIRRKLDQIILNAPPDIIKLDQMHTQYLKCVRCGITYDLHDYTFNTVRKTGKYTSKLLTMTAPVCAECESKFKEFSKHKGKRYIVYCAGIPGFIIGSFLGGGIYTLIIIPFFIFGAIIIEWLLLKHKNNPRKYLKFAYKKDTPKIKHIQTGVWLDKENWINLILYENANVNTFY